MVICTDILLIDLNRICSERKIKLIIARDCEEKIEIYAGRFPNRDFGVSGYKPKHFEHIRNYKDMKMHKLDPTSLVCVEVLSSFCPNQEISLEDAENIAYQMSRKYNKTVRPQSASIAPTNAKAVTEITMEQNSRGKFSPTSFEQTCVGEIKCTYYFASVKDLGELKTAIELVEACRKEHKKKVLVTDVMKTIPEWQRLLRTAVVEKAT
jgi:hypothetical protein